MPTPSPEFSTAPALRRDRDRIYLASSCCSHDRHHRALRPGVHALHIGRAAQQLDGDDGEQVLHFLRQRAEAVTQFRAEAIHCLLIVQVGEAAVEA